MTVTATEQKLQSIAQMDASKQFIDANANVKGRCFCGWILTLLRLNHISFIRNYMNACCDANLTQTATKVKDLINASLKETSEKSAEDKTKLYTDVLAKINPILDKAKVAKLDLNEILNPKKDDAPPSEPTHVPPPSDLDVSYKAPTDEKAGGEPAPAPGQAPGQVAGQVAGPVQPEAPQAPAKDAPVGADAPVVGPTFEEPSVLSDGVSIAEDARINFTMEPLNAAKPRKAPTDRSVQKFLRDANDGKHNLHKDGTYHYRGYKITVTPKPQADAKS